MTAVSLGVDLVAKLRLACGTRVGHIAWGAATFSSTAVTGKLLRPDENETRNGLDLAYSQSLDRFSPNWTEPSTFVSGTGWRLKRECGRRS